MKGSVPRLPGPLNPTAGRGQVHHRWPAGAKAAFQAPRLLDDPFRCGGGQRCL